MKTHVPRGMWWILALGLLSSLIACARGHTPTPPPSRPPRHPTVARSPSPIRVPIVESGKSTPRPATKGPLVHFPWMSTGGKTPEPTPEPSPAATVRPSPRAETPPPHTRTHLPVVWGGAPLVQEEPLEGEERGLAVIVDASARSRATWSLLTHTLPPLLAAVPTPISLTLWSLGGEGEGCAAGDPLVHTTSPADAAWSSILGNLRPGGKAPIGEVLLKAAEAFPATSHRPLILLTHSARGCGDDPCSVARVLERAQTDVSVHVIAIQVSEEDADALRCVAETTGGTFHRVDSSDALARAWQEALTHALGGQLRVEVAGVAGHPFFPSVVVGRKGQIVSTFEAWTDADLAPGVYSVSVGTPLPTVLDRVFVHAGERTRVHIPLGELHVRLSDPAGQAVRGEITVWDDAHGPFFSVFDRAAVIPLPTGTYTVSARIPTWYEPLAYARALPLTVGEAISRTLRLSVGRLSVSIRIDGAAGDAFVTVAPSAHADTPTVAGWGHGEMTFVLPPDVYTLSFTRYTDTGVFYRPDAVAVQPGERTHLQVDLSTAHVHVLRHASDGTDISGRVELLPAGRSEPVVVDGEVGERLEAPAGTYDVRVKREDGEVLWMWDVDVAGGEDVAVEVVRPQGRIWGYVVGNAPATVQGYMQLQDEETGSVVAEGWAPVRWVVPEGTYHLWVADFDVLGRRKDAGTLTVDAGAAITRTVTLDLARVRIEPVDADEVRVSIAPHDDRARVLKGWTSPLPDFLIVPGTYDIRVVDPRHPERDHWFDDVRLEAGRTRVLRVRLRD